MKTLSLIVVLMLAQPVAAPFAAEGSRSSPWEKLGRIFGRSANTATNGTSAVPSSVAVADLTSDQITRGLKEALAKGLDRAVTQLGQPGGFLTNVNVRIPMPQHLQTVETALRRVGQDQLADEFVGAMNHAAEKAVPAAAAVFTDSLKQITVDDARAILKGADDAATQYFRRTAGPQLEEKFRPIIAGATTEAGVTAAYKKLTGKASFATAFFGGESFDLDAYVTGRATDGLFKMIAEEEKRIRRDPVARTTDVLRTVFGALGRQVPVRP